jgi:hypothetical protein
VIRSVMVGRPMPLKNPRSDQTATPSGAPNMRGNQYASASSAVSAGRSNGANSLAPQNARAVKNGMVKTDEASVGRVEHGLHGAVQHEREGKPGNRRVPAPRPRRLSGKQIFFVVHRGRRSRPAE